MGIHGGTPKTSYPQLREHLDAAVGVMPLCMAGEMWGAGGFLHPQPHLARAGCRRRRKPSAIGRNDVGPGKPPNHHLIREEKACLLLMQEVTF